MKYYLLIFFTSLLLLACKEKKQVIFPKTDLQLTVQNDSTTLDGAIVALFETQTAYKNAYKNFSTQGAVRVDSTKNGGIVLFKDLEAKNYFIATYYKDYNYKNYYKLYGIYTMFDNDITGDSLPHDLNKGALTEGTIKVTPAETLISFWASDNLSGRTPIKITVNNTTLDSLTSVMPSAPTSYFLSTIRTVKLRRGPNPYVAMNSSGCKTIETINIPGGEIANHNINVNTCRSGFVSFWTVSENKDLKIDVFVNSNTKVGTLTNNFLSTAPTSCLAINTLHYSLVPGSHTYTATAPGCAWTGSFTIDSTTSCSPANIIKLEKCNR